MSFDEILAEAIELLKRERRMSYRALKRRLDVDDALLDDLKAEIVQAKRLAFDEDAAVLVWAGDDPQAGPVLAPAMRSRSPAGERRHLTVMFCDLVGSTQLSQRLDPEELSSVIQGYHEISAAVVARFGGYVSQYFGDGILIYFSYPVAHEDDAQRAVRAGLELVAAMRTDKLAANGAPLQIRVGIHTGLVVVRDIGVGDARDLTAIIGETPNLAARIQQAAEPGGVVISAATWRLVKGFFSGENLGPQQFKGIANAVEVYRVTGDSEAEGRFEAASGAALTPFVGRRAEFNLLLRRWRTAERGKGQVAAISGEAGIGKSRLLYEIKRQVLGDGGVQLEFHCSPYHENTALYPVIHYLHRILRFRADDSPADRLAKLEDALSARSFPDADTVPLLASLLSIPLPQGDSLAAFSPQRRKEKTLAALLAWIRETAASAPICVTFEDLQWADPSTLELLVLFIEQAPAMRALALLSFRPGMPPPWRADPPISVLILNRLENMEARRIAEGVAGGKPLPPEVMAEILNKTDGVPLFVEEMTRTVLESGVVRMTDEGYALAGAFPSPAVPVTIHDLLMARLDRMEGFKEIAQLGAVLGREFSHELMRAVSPLDEAALQRGLDKLVEAQLLYRRGVPPHATYFFKHALIQETAYQSILISGRQEHHRRIARALERQFPEFVRSQPELLAHHYTEGDLRSEAILYRQAAAEKAVQRSANVEAINHLRKALGLLETLPENADRRRTELMLQVAMGAPLMATRGFASPEAEKVYARARELCEQAGEAPQLFPVLWGLWLFYTARARHTAALELARRCMNVARRADDVALTLEAHHALGVTLLALGEFKPALEHLQQAIEIYDPVKHRALAFAFGQDSGVVCLSHAAWALWFLGYPDQARRRNREALVLAQESSHPFSLAVACDFAAWLDQICRDEDAIRERADAAIAVSIDLQFAFWMNMGLILRGWALTRQGELDEGAAQMRLGLSGYEAGGNEIMKPYFLALFAEVCERRGKVEEGLAFLAQAQELVERNDERWWEAELHRQRGELILAGAGLEGAGPATWDAAERCFRDALAIARRQSARSLELRAAMSLSRLLRRRGGARAHSILAETYAGFDEGFDTPDLGEARRILREIASDESDS